ncbi:MAG: hypothetical protein N6V41_01540, partial [Candidatus Portiera aleyrodidarum]|nr:hypothetical protein [Candidatus Portiera aleyrodidarum]
NFSQPQSRTHIALGNCNDAEMEIVFITFHFSASTNRGDENVVVVVVVVVVALTRLPSSLSARL